jgi:hypothetical protein
MYYSTKLDEIASVVQDLVEIHMIIYMNLDASRLDLVCVL